MNIWFTSDLHFGHKNILQFEKEHRPFSTLEEMHEVLIQNWNSVVKPKDKIYVLGDFAFGKHNIPIARRLNGHKRLILGNHDSYPVEKYLPFFEKIYGLKYWEHCILSHAPLHPHCLSGHHESYGIESPNFLNAHGHLHSRKVMVKTYKDVEDTRYFNVSVEQNNLTPIHADVIRQRWGDIS